MNTTTLFLIVPFMFLIGSIYALSVSVLERRVKLSGSKAVARVVKVERAILSGLASLLPGKEGAYKCDYLLRLSYSTSAGKPMEVSTTVAARMKIREGKRLPFFAEGDRIPIRYSEKHPRSVVVLMETIEQRQGRIFPIVLWAFCSSLLVAIIVTVFVS